MQPLYCFKLNEETGEIRQFKITEYEIGRAHWSNKQSYYRFKINGATFYCYENDLNRFKHSHVYSHSPSLDHAKSIIITEVKKRRAKARREYKKWDNAFKGLCGEPVETTIEAEIDKLQTYKLYVGSDEILVRKDDVKDIVKNQKQG